MRCPFVVGQKVVCIDDNWVRKDVAAQMYHMDTKHPKLNQVLTIRKIKPSEQEPYLDDALLYFEEIRNPVKLWACGMDEACFFHWHFAPIQEKKTDISQFEKLLAPAPKVRIKEVA